MSIFRRLISVCLTLAIPLVALAAAQPSNSPADIIIELAGELRQEALLAAS
jgi:hypothetical protein